MAGTSESTTVTTLAAPVVAAAVVEETPATGTGSLEASVNLECQRCMQAMPAVLTSRFTLGVVTSDAQAQQLPKELEPFLTDEFSADLWAMVEDELLLVLPPFPLHERDDCPARADLEAYEPEHSPEAPKKAAGKENPFSVLAELKRTKH